MTASAEYRVAGDVLDADGERLAAGLAGGPWHVRRKSVDEVALESDDASFAFYARASHPGWFLISGELAAGAGGARALLADLAGRLAAAGLVYHLELERSDDADDQQVLDHPDW